MYDGHYPLDSTEVVPNSVLLRLLNATRKENEKALISFYEKDKSKLIFPLQLYKHHNIDKVLHMNQRHTQWRTTLPTTSSFVFNVVHYSVVHGRPFGDPFVLTLTQQDTTKTVMDKIRHKLQPRQTIKGVGVQDIWNNEWFRQGKCQFILYFTS